MEDTNLLDPTDVVDLFCLHLVYLPYINHVIKLFIEAWCSHPMSSSGNQTPTQLWIEGMLNNSTSHLRVTQELYYDENPDLVSIVWAPLLHFKTTGTIQCILFFHSISDSKEVILASDCHTVDVYVNVNTLFQNMPVTVHLTLILQCHTFTTVIICTHSVPV